MLVPMRLQDRRGCEYVRCEGSWEQKLGVLRIFGEYALEDGKGLDETTGMNNDNETVYAK